MRCEKCKSEIVTLIEDPLTGEPLDPLTRWEQHLCDDCYDAIWKQLTDEHCPECRAKPCGKGRECWINPWPQIMYLCYIAPKTQEKNTQDEIETLFINFKEFLKSRNMKYGDSALNPINIFSKHGAEDQVCNRLDDKLSRIKNSQQLRKNDACDAFGYLALLMIKHGWTSFEDLDD